MVEIPLSNHNKFRIVIGNPPIMNNTLIQCDRRNVFFDISGLLKD